MKILRNGYDKIISSIAFYPALIAIGFLVLSWLMLELDFSETGKNIKAYYSLIRLKDASTARSIVSVIAGGIISLMVFSFSMVMILLNQAASQMSNRMLESMIGNRFQQLVLGAYIGTIVYALFLLSTIRDIESGIYVPALSIYLLVLITVADIFAFIYFLHYVTQSVKFETIIERVHKQTMKSLKKTFTLNQPEASQSITEEGFLLVTRSAGYFQGFDEKSLLHFTREHDGIVEFVYPSGTFLLNSQPVLKWFGRVLTDEEKDELLFTLNFYSGQPVHHNYYYGFRQLTEVAIKALSPGINDPGTAVLSLHALADLFSYRLVHYPRLMINDESGFTRIIISERPFDQLFVNCIYPIWDYGSGDRYIRDALSSIMNQLRQSDSMYETLLIDLQKKISSKVAELND